MRLLALLLLVALPATAQVLPLATCGPNTVIAGPVNGFPSPVTCRTLVGDDLPQLPNGNTANGLNSLYSLTTGENNTASGIRTLYALTTGRNNTATGANSLASNTTGYDNSGFGAGTLHYTTTGFYNTAIGVDSMASNTTGRYNTAVGVDGLVFNVDGSKNTTIGVNGLYHNTSGEGNVASGYEALYWNTTGGNNTATGGQSLYTNTTGDSNTAVGVAALFRNATGRGNVAIGPYAGAWETGSNTFYVANTGQVDVAGDRAFSLLYGTFAASSGTLAGQKLTVNALLNVNLSALAVYTNNSAAVDGGLRAGDLYRTGGDPDVVAVVH